MDDYKIKDDKIPEEIKKKAKERELLEKKVTESAIQMAQAMEIAKNMTSGPTKVEVINQVEPPEIKTEKVEFPEVQKVSIVKEILAKITNFPAFPSFMKIEGKVKADVDFPDTQKIKGKVDVEFPKTQKVYVENQPKSVDVDNLPIGKSDYRNGEPTEGAPDRYIPVRLTDGKNFYASISTAISSATRAIRNFVDSTGRSKAALVDNDGHMQADVLTAPNIDIGDEQSRQLGIVTISGSAFDPKSKPGYYTSAQANTNLWSPTISGAKIHITDILATSSAACVVEIWSLNTRQALYTLAANGGAVENLKTPIRLAANESIDIRTSATSNVFVRLNGYEV